MKRHSARPRLLILSAMAVIAVAAQRLELADASSWTNSGSGDYNTASNWDSFSVPSTPADEALINNGGTANYASGISFIDQIVVGSGAGQSGAFTMTGGTMSPVTAIFGQSGNGTATINGGNLAVGGGSVFIGGSTNGAGTGGVGVLNLMGGPSSQVSSGDDFQMGRNGSGTLNMSGGYARGVYTVIGKFGTGTWNMSGGVFDQYGDGDFEIGDGGKPGDSGVAGPRQGTINLTGGVIHGDGHLAIGNRVGTGVVNVSGGVLDITGLPDGNIYVGRGMDWGAGQGGATTLHVTGNAGIIVANGAFDMNSSGVASSSTLVEEITSASQTTIRVAGDAKLANGALQVKLNGYAPVSGDSWTIIEAGANLTSSLSQIDSLVSSGGYSPLTHDAPAAVGTLMGNFASIDYSQATLSPGLSWNISYDANKVTLSVSGGSFLPADFNHDTHVNAADLAIWKTAYGSTAAGDANNDGKTDGADYLVWQRQFAPSVSVAASVPEPSAIILSAMGLVALWRRARG